MRVAVISDIHGNFDALTAVLDDIDQSRVAAVFCLGDCIGYGAEPDRVIRELFDRGIPTTLGNHELAVLKRDHLARFNPMAKASLIKTISMLSEKTLEIIRGLPAVITSHNARFVHGFPPDAVTTYSFEYSPEDMRRILGSLTEPISFFGHTHELNIISYDGRTLTEEALETKTRCIETGCRYAVNVGSVGQPRDGNNKAKYVIWDKDFATIEVKFVAYDIAAAVNKIIAAGLPEVHANRLW